MARTFISQFDQVFHSEHYNDALATGPALQVSASTLEDDLNSIRTQVRQLLWANVSGSWYDAVTAPSGGLSARGVNTLNLDLTDLEQKRFLFRRQQLNLINVATGSNFVFLSTSLGTTPSNFAVVSHPLLPSTLATGSLTALLSGTEGSYGAHSMAQTSGSTVITPKNLVLIRDAWTGAHLTGTYGKDVYGLLQVESGTLTGDAFNDTTHRTQISFIEEIVVNGTSSLSATLPTYVGGKTLMYSYVRRTALDDIPEDAYLSNTIFLDLPESFAASGFAALGDITLDRAIDNQVGIVTQDQSIDIRIAAGFHWAFLSGTKELWRLDSSNSADLLTVAVDRFAVSSTFPSTFQQGVSVATGSTQIDVGVVVGRINTLTGSNLTIKGGTKLSFSDDFGGTSTYLTGELPFATATLEWNNFATDFGNQTSLLGALHFLSQSLSGSRARIRYTAGVNVNVAADVNVTFPTNLDAQLGNYTGKDFKADLNVYLNGVLLLPGTSLETNDVYPGTSPASGDLKFPYSIRSGSQVSIEIFH